MVEDVGGVSGMGSSLSRIVKRSEFRKAARKEGKCDICPPNRGENANDRRKPHGTQKSKGKK